MTMPRLHLTRALGPFFLGAMFMYTLLILHSYHSLNVLSDRRHKLDAAAEGFVDRIPHRHRKAGAARDLGHVGRERRKGSAEVNDKRRRLDSIANGKSSIKRYVDEPIDAHTYNYIHIPDVCRKSNGRRIKMLLIFIVTTAPANFDRRALIRATYGNRRNWPVLHAGAFRTIFMLGAVRDATLQARIDDEFATHGDILQEDFLDSYMNLTLKTVMGLKWVTNHCRQATFTMKLDDDSMIHQNRLLRLLKNASSTNFTAAEALIDTPVLRNTSSKYYISEEYFPAPTYPPYLNGPGYMLSTDLAEGIYRVAIATPLFPWEDVFLGICLQQLKVVPQVYHDFILIIAEFSQISNKTEAAKLFRYYTVVSNLDAEYMTLMWDTCRFKMRTA